MTNLQINPEVCRACPHCAAAHACRLKAIVQIDLGEPPYLETSRCRDCRVCMLACPYQAVQKIKPNEAHIL